MNTTSHEFWQGVVDLDAHLDSGCSDDYKEQPLAQDWGRVAKAVEEVGEAIAELISLTGQNPRKGRDSEALPKLVDELADIALTGIYAMQHFIKNGDKTQARLVERCEYHLRRVGLR